MKLLSKLNIFFIILITSVVLFLFAYFFYLSESREIINERHEFLHAVTNLKLEQVTGWKKDRTADAQFFATIGKFITYTQDLNKNKNVSEANQYFSKTLKQFTANGYDENIVITDVHGKILFSIDNELKQFNPERIAEINHSLIQDSVAFGDFYFNQTNKELRINIISVIKDNNGIPIGTFVQQIDPNKSLISIIHKWPTISKTAETLLFKKENDQIVYLNELRHKKNTALILKIPLSQKEVITVQGVLGKTGIIEGKDYRGVDVLAELRSIPGTDWFLVSKVDKAELFSEIFFRGEVIFIIVLLSILFITSIALYIYKLQQSRIYKNLFLKQKELAETQEEFKTALYSIGDAVITTDTRGNIKQMNIIAENLTGWKETEAKGKSINAVFNIIDEDNNIKVDNPVDRVLKQGAVIGLANHTMLIRKDGKQLPIADSGSPIKNEEKEIIGVVLVFRDQTEERKKEKLLTESEQRFRKAFTTSPDSVNINRMSDGMYVSVNNGFLKLTGYSEAEVIGKTSFEINIWADSKDREELVSGLKTNGSVKNLEARFRLKNGEVRHGLMSASILELNGEMHILSITRDISEIKRAQEKIKDSEANLNSLINNRNEAIWSIDRDYNYIVFNKYFSDSYFATFKQKLVNGINAIEILTPELKAFWKPKYDTALSGEKIEFEFTAEQHNEIKVYQVFLNPIISDQKISGVSALSVDITESRWAENELKKFARKDEEALKIAKMGHWEFDILKRQFVFNDQYFLLHATNAGEAGGYQMSAEEFSGKYVHPDNAHLVKEHITRAIETNDPNFQVQTEARVLQADGKPRDFAIWFRIEKDAQGKTTKLYGVNQDITERKLAEKSLLEKQLQLESIVNSTPIVLFNLDKNGIFTLSEGRGLDVLGLKPGQVVGMSAFEVYKDYPSILAAIKKGLQGEIQSAIHDMGNWVFDVSYTPQKDEDGSIIGLTGVATDITNSKKVEQALSQSEQRLRLSLKAANQGLYDLNIQTGKAIVNDEYASMLGYDPKVFKETNSLWIERLHPNDREVTAKAYSDYIEGKTEEYKVEFRQKTKNNEWKWILSLGKIVEYDSDGKPLRMLGTHTDITEQKRLITELIEAKEKAEEMNRVKAYFFANMSHELRTPFVGIMGFSEILAGSLKEPEEKEMAEQILKSSKRLTDTLNKILNVTRLEFDRLDIKLSNFDVVDLITQLTELFSKSASLQNTVLKTNFQSASLVIYSDAKLLDEIISNLVNNAIKFTHNGVVEISAVDTIKNDENILTIKVTDNGVGIPKDKQKVIWEEFRQVSEGMNRSFEGTGLGLTLIRKYVNTLNGKIYLESEMGKGSTFTIEIPIKKGVDIFETAKKLELEQKNKTIQIKSDKKPRVLYVEDDSIALSYVGLVLKSDYDIETAFDAKIAMEKVSNVKFDVLLLDINLGKGTDGVELMQMIRKLDNYKSTPMVAVTAYADIKDKEEFLVKGFTHYISKPFISKDLLDLLKKVVV